MFITLINPLSMDYQNKIKKYCEQIKNNLKQGCDSIREMREMDE